MGDLNSRPLGGLPGPKPLPIDGSSPAMAVRTSHLVMFDFARESLWTAPAADQPRNMTGLRPDMVELQNERVVYPTVDTVSTSQYCTKYPVISCVGGHAE